MFEIIWIVWKSVCGYISYTSYRVVYHAVSRIRKSSVEKDIHSKQQMSKNKIFIIMIYTIQKLHRTLQISNKKTLKHFILFLYTCRIYRCIILLHIILFILIIRATYFWVSMISSIVSYYLTDRYAHVTSLLSYRSEPCTFCTIGYFLNFIDRSKNDVSSFRSHEKVCSGVRILFLKWFHLVRHIRRIQYIIVSKWTTSVK